MAEDLRLILIALAVLTLLAAVGLEAGSFDASDAWKAFLGVVGLLVGQHLDKPTKPLPFMSGDKSAGPQQ